MKIMRLISIVNFLFVLLLLPNAYAQYPTSTPQFLESIDFGAIFSDSIATNSSNSSTASNLNQATSTWTGGGDDELASNPQNWSGGLVPQNGDHVVFDGTSIKNAIWNLLVTLYSLVIGSDYTGVVTISDANLTIGNFVQWTGGGDDELASNPDNWSGNSVPLDGDNILFDTSSPNNCTWNISITPKIFVIRSDYGGTVTLNSDLALTGSLTVSGGTLALSNKALNVDGYLLINPGGTIDAGSSTITVKGNWFNNGGNFLPGTSTVILSGTNQHIYGSTTFYNLLKTVTSSDILYFEAGSTQIIINSLTLQGANDNLLSLRSTIDGQPWYIDPQGTRNITYVNIRDLHNISFTGIVVLPDSFDGGNNTGVSFGGNQCVSLIPLWLRELMGDYRGWAC